MPLTGELPDLIITSKTQSPEYIKTYMEGIGYNVDTVEEITDETAPTPPAEPPPAEPNPTEPAPAAPAPPPTAEPEGDEEDDEDPPAPATPAEPKKKSGSARYKEQRDLARQEAEALKLEKARLEGEQAELRRQITERSKPAEPAAAAPAEQVPAAVIPDEPAAPALPDKPKLIRPKLVEPKLDDPGIENDFDKWTEARGRALEEWQTADATAQEDYNDKIYDWRRAVDKLQGDHQKAVEDRATAQVRARKEQEEREQRADLDKILNAGRTRHADFDAVASKTHHNPDGSPLIINSVPMQVALREIGLEDNELGSDLIYWIATNPQEAHLLAKSTDLKPDASPEERAKAHRKAMVAFSKIASKFSSPVLAAPSAGVVTTPVNEPDEPAVPDPAPPAAPEIPPASPAPAASQPAGQPPPKKHTPVAPVGARGAANYKRLKEMTAGEIAALHPDEYRKRYQDGEAN